MSRRHVRGGRPLLGRAEDVGQVRDAVRIADLLKLVNAIAWATERASDAPDQIDRMTDVVMIGIRTGRPGTVIR